jgi:hypothetical protein
VAAASADSKTLVRPEEAGPQISLKHPRGSPPESSSISRIPLETISGAGRISSRDAAVTPPSLGNAARRCKTSAGSFLAAKTTAPPIGAGKANNEDIQDLYISGNAEAAGRGCESQFRFLFANQYLALGGKDCQERR